MAGAYAIVWEFLVEDRTSAEFERHYGPAGTYRAFRGSFADAYAALDRSARR